VKIATWNVNSIRQRLERLDAWLERARPDLVCLQETKVVDEAFPREHFTSQGWHVEVFGQKTYNGVALLSRTPIADVVRGLPDDAPDAPRRVIGATVGGLRVLNVYVPNGESVTSEKFVYKLAWLARLEGFLAAELARGLPLVLLGDFNIAPEDRDVHDPEAWRGQVLFHPKEHAALARLQALGLSDLYRKHHAEAGRYTWWDYRALAFPMDRGLRIDLILGTAEAARRSSACEIHRDERKGQKPSDHAPVVVTLTDG
jgi:exodeoxyribonuclease-3